MKKDSGNNVSLYAETKLPTIHGDFKVYVFRSRIDFKEHLAIAKGEFANSSTPVPVRVHSECLTSQAGSAGPFEQKPTVMKVVNHTLVFNCVLKFTV